MRLEEAEIQLAQARINGDTTVTLNGVDFVDYNGNSLLTASGECSAAQRVSAQMAGLDTSCFSCCATSTGEHLKGAGKAVSQRTPGTLLVFSLSHPICHMCGQPVGHIACYVGQLNGVDTCAENTSCASRGNPLAAGFKLTPLHDIDASGDRLNGIYSLEQVLPQSSFAPGDIVVKVNDAPYLGYFDGTDSFLYVTNADGTRGTMKVRPAAEAAGCVPPQGIVVAHFAESPRCVYVYGPFAVPAGAIPWARQ